MWYKIMEHKGGRKCVDCGITSAGPIYDLHHVDPKEKLFNIGAEIRKWSKELEAEVDKCVLLCSNCHRLRHWKESWGV